MRGPECPLLDRFCCKSRRFRCGSPAATPEVDSSSFPIGRWGVRSMEADVRHCYARRVSIAGGGRGTSLASRRRFCAMAPSVPFGAMGDAGDCRAWWRNSAVEGKSMGRQTAVVLALYAPALVAVVVGVDVLFFRNRFWERLIVNVGIVLVFWAFYLRFLRRP